MKKRDLFLVGQSLWLHHPGGSHGSCSSPRSTPTTWRPTPGRRSAPSLTTKSVSLGFPFFPRVARLLQGAVFLFNMWLYAGFETLLVLQDEDEPIQGSLQSGCPLCLPGKGGSAWICSRGSKPSLLPLRPCFSPSQI